VILYALKSHEISCQDIRSTFIGAVNENVAKNEPRGQHPHSENNIFCSECYMHFTGVVGTSAWAGVYVRQVCFYTNVHICDTLAAGCAHMCICIYVCICMYLHMDAYARL